MATMSLPAGSDTRVAGEITAHHTITIEDFVDVYRDEGKSGRDRKRAGLARLRADAAQGRFDVVLVAHHKRLAATEVDAQAIIEDLEGHGVTVDSLAGDLPLIPR